MYANLFEKLLSKRVEFLVLGGAAVSLHGFARMTEDIDILLQNSRDNIDRFVSAVSQWGDGCGKDLTFEDFQGPGCVRIEENFPLDVFTILNGKTYDDFARNAAKYRLDEGFDLKCLSIPDLIEAKKGTLREKDQIDVTVLERIKAAPQQGEPPSIHLDGSSAEK